MCIINTVSGSQCSASCGSDIPARLLVDHAHGHCMLRRLRRHAVNAIELYLNLTQDAAMDVPVPRLDFHYAVMFNCATTGCTVL